MPRKNDLSEVFSSQARFRVLQALAFLTEGLRLRELERATQLQIRSIQGAVVGLIQDGILMKNKDGFFRLNPRSSLARRAQGMFRYLRDEELRQNARSLSIRAKQVIRLSNEVIQTVNAARQER